MNAERHLVTFAVSPAPGRDPAVGDSVAYAGPSSQTVMAAWSRDMRYPPFGAVDGPSVLIH
jgi:hypothetical protein